MGKNSGECELNKGEEGGKVNCLSQYLFSGNLMYRNLAQAFMVGIPEYELISAAVRFYEERQTH